MTYILDTNVISAVAPSHVDRAVALAQWMDEASAALYLSVVSVMEVRDGIAKATREGAGRKAANLSSWWNSVEHLYFGRILPFDFEAARIAGNLADLARGRGHNPGFSDIAIAATAQARGYVVLTRNIRHFAPLGGLALDPFLALPPLPGGAPN